MKARLLTGIAALAFCATACQDDETALNQGNSVSGIFTAVMEQPIDARSTVTDEGVFSWTDGDKITVISDDGSTTDKINMTVVEGKGTFSLTNVTSPKYATYPQIASEYSDGNLTKVSLPASYGDSENPYAASTNAAMFADMTGISNYDTDEVKFRHLAGVLRIKFSRVPAGCNQFIFTATGKNITGEFSLDTSNENPEIKLGDNEGDGSSVTFNFKELQAAQPMTFYIPLPVGTYDGFEVKLMGNSKEIYTKSSATTNQKIERRTLALLPEVTDDIAAVGLKEGLYYSIDGGAYQAFPETLGSTFAKATTIKIRTVGETPNFTPTQLDKLMNTHPVNLEVLDMKDAKYLDADNNAGVVVAFPSNVNLDTETEKRRVNPLLGVSTMKIKRMILPDNVTKLFICSEAEDETVDMNSKKNRLPFAGHTKLETVEFGEKLVELNCAEIQIGDQTDIHTAMPGIKQIKKIGYRVFDMSNKQYTGNINLETCEEIGKQAFARSLFSNVILSSTSKVKIAASAFNGATELTTIENWGSVTSIGDNAFNGATSFKGTADGTLDFSNIETLGTYAFCNTVIQKIKIGAKLTNIPDFAFFKCFKLSEIDFVGCNSNLTIRGCAFGSTNQEHSLTFVTIPAGVKMHPTAFIGIKSLHTLTLNETTDLEGDKFVQENGVLFNSAKTILYMYPACAKDGVTAETQYTIPEGITTIGWGAFFSNQTLKEIVIPSHVTSFESNGSKAVSTFWGSKIEKVDMSASPITAIGNECFKAAESLKEISLPATLTSIGDQAFKYTGSLQTIICNNKTAAPTIVSTTFNTAATASGSATGGNATDKKVIYPKDCGSIYVNESSSFYTTLLTSLGYTFEEATE